MKIVITLEQHEPERIHRVLASVPEIEIASGRRAQINLDGVSKGLSILPRAQRGLWPDLDRDAVALAQTVPRGNIGLVVAGAIPIPEREALERAGLSWCDGRGALSVKWHGGYILIDRTAHRRAKGKTQPSKGLGPASIRALQVLLETTRGQWTVAQVAQSAAISIGQAHTVLQALDENHLLKRTGKGPLQRSEITDRRAALDWLAMLDRPRRRPQAAATYLYSRTPDDLLRQLAVRAGQAGLPYAVTGAAASTLLGTAVLTRIPIVHVRVGLVDAADALHRLGLEHLNAEDVGRGANLELWTDTGDLGVFAATEVDGIKVAPHVRIWLDLYREGGRGEDAAQIFREQVLERT